MVSKPYDIVLLPEKSILVKAIELSEKLNEYEKFFTLGEHDYFPHLSLYMLQIKNSNLAEVQQRLKKISATTNVITGQASEYHFESGYFDIEYEKSNFTNLQNSVVEIIEPLRDGLREKDKKRLDYVEGEERENILKYGYRSIGNLFAPHLTFTRFINSEIHSLKKLPDKNIFSGEFRSLGLFEMGDNGTCRYKVNEWFLRE